MEFGPQLVHILISSRHPSVSSSYEAIHGDLGSEACHEQGCAVSNTEQSNIVQYIRVAAIGTLFS